MRIIKGTKNATKIVVEDFGFNKIKKFLSGTITFKINQPRANIKEHVRLYPNFIKQSFFKQNPIYKKISARIPKRNIGVTLKSITFNLVT